MEPNQILTQSEMKTERAQRSQICSHTLTTENSHKSSITGQRTYRKIISDIESGHLLNLTLSILVRSPFITC